ncbi:MAG: PP2C family protein-serine/threonine phosphatase [Spirochaetes bacterium]|nr:PP2C family protein-serine/threonine phosphatase [Spirochaetota bacterium]
MEWLLPAIAVVLIAVPLSLILAFSLKWITRNLPAISIFNPSAAVFEAVDEITGRYDPSAAVVVSSLDTRTSLEGVWRIKLGDGIERASSDYDDSAWDAYRFPSNYMPYVYAKKGMLTGDVSGILWIRKTIHVKPGLSREDVGLILGRIGNADETFFNGVKIGSTGSFPPDEFSMWNFPRYYKVPSSLIRYGGENVISVRIWYYAFGQIQGSMALTGINDWEESKTISNFTIITLDYVIIAAGLPIYFIFFFFYLRRRMSQEYFFYCLQLLCGLFIILELCNYWNIYGSQLFRLKFLVYMWTGVNVAHPIFLHRIYDLKRKKTELFLWMLMLTVLIVGTCYCEIYDVRQLGILSISALIGIGFYNLSCHVSALVKRRLFAKMFAFFGLTVILGAIHDGFVYIFKFIGIDPHAGPLFQYMLFPYSAFVLYMGTAMVLVARFIRMGEDISDMNVNLENKIGDRTQELHAAMEELELINGQLVETRDSLWGEMQLAKKIQTVLLPEEPSINGYEIAACMKPAAQVGGDYYDVINTAGKDWLVIGDVSGHGVPAGLVMMMVVTAVRSAVSMDPGITPARLLSMVNGTITGNIRNLEEDKYMTITALATGGAGEFVFAGLHQDILVYRAGSGTVEFIETSGFWLGIEEDISSMVEDSRLRLGPGDVMLVFTDGVTEATRKEGPEASASSAGSMYGHDNLKRVFSLHGNKRSGEIAEEILRSMADYENDDDVTMVVVKRV